MQKWELAMRLVGVGFYIAFCIIGGVWAGLWLDHRFHTLPIFMLIGLILGLILAFWGVYQLLRPFLSDKQERR
jgi:F0F1-type ATP synthase assembly protein I